MTLMKIRPEHERPGYKGPRVLRRYAQWLFSYWLKFPKRKPHQGARECERRREQISKALWRATAG